LDSLLGFTLFSGGSLVAGAVAVAVAVNGFAIIVAVDDGMGECDVLNERQ